MTISGGGILALTEPSPTINTLTLANTTVGTNLTLGSGTGAGDSLLLDINATANTTDSIAVGQRLNLTSVGATVGLNTFSGTTLANGTYNLVTFATSSSAAGSFSFGAFTGNFTNAGGGNVIQIGSGRSYNLDWNNNGTLLPATSGNFSAVNSSALVLSVITNAAPTNAYWSGAQDTNWNTINNLGNDTNWLDGPAGTDTHQIPGLTSDVFLTANSATRLHQHDAGPGLHDQQPDDRRGRRHVEHDRHQRQHADAQLDGHGLVGDEQWRHDEHQLDAGRRQQPDVGE